jgi:hypothetical protein
LLIHKNGINSSQFSELHCLHHSESMLGSFTFISSVYIFFSVFFIHVNFVFDWLLQ